MSGSRILAATSQSSSPAQFVPCSFCINLHIATNVICAFIFAGARCSMQIESGFQTTLIHSSSGLPVLQRCQFARPLMTVPSIRPTRSLFRYQSPRTSCRSRSTELPCVDPDLASQRLSTTNSSCGLLSENLKLVYYQDYFEYYSDLFSPP